MRVFTTNVTTFCFNYLYTLKLYNLLPFLNLPFHCGLMEFYSHLCKSFRGSGAFENKLYVIPEWSLLNLSYGDRLERKKRGLPNPLVQAQHSLQYSVDPKNGVPAEYKQSRKGAYHQNTWQTPLLSTNRQSPSPSGIAQNNNERSPRVSYNSLGSHSSLQNRQFNSPV